MKKDCGCEKTSIESFDENPGSFYGWLYLTMTLVLAAVVLFFFAPIFSVIFVIIGLFIALMQFGFYKKFVDGLFEKKEGHNVTATKACAGEIKRRVLFNGHVDAAWEWPVNYKLGGVGFEGHAIIGIVGAIYYMIIAIIYCAQNGVHIDVIDKTSPLFTAGLWGLLFVPFMIGLYFMWNKNRVVDGANDNLTGCYMGIAILKELKDQGINLENTEVGVVITGSEEAGLRGAMAWAEKHEHDYDDVPTYIISYDTIHDPKQLMVNYRDLNGTVKADKDVSDLFMKAAKEVNVPIKKGWVPPLGGATDSAAFAKKGFKVTGITGLNHKLEDYYHTRYL